MQSEYLEILLKLFLSVIIGGVIGIERQSTRHNAGMRTHILVCLGAAVVMILSCHIVEDFQGDVTRIGAQVVSGVGFLGAGCILVNGNRIKGLTTAAGLWSTACVGLAIGMGYYFLSIAAALFIFGAMLLLHPIGNFINRKKLDAVYKIELKVKNKSAIKEIISELSSLEYNLRLMEEQEDKRVVFEISGDKNNFPAILSALGQMEDVSMIRHIPLK